MPCPGCRRGESVPGWLCAPCFHIRVGRRRAEIDSFRASTRRTIEALLSQAVTPAHDTPTPSSTNTLHSVPHSSHSPVGDVAHLRSLTATHPAHMDRGVLDLRGRVALARARLQSERSSLVRRRLRVQHRRTRQRDQGSKLRAKKEELVMYAPVLYGLRSRHAHLVGAVADEQARLVSCLARVYAGGRDNVRDSDGLNAVVSGGVRSGARSGTRNDVGDGDSSIGSGLERGVGNRVESDKGNQMGRDVGSGASNSGRRVAHIGRNARSARSGIDARDAQRNGSALRAGTDDSLTTRQPADGRRTAQQYAPLAIATLPTHARPWRACADWDGVSRLVYLLCLYLDVPTLEVLLVERDGARPLSLHCLGDLLRPSSSDENFRRGLRVLRLSLAHLSSGGGGGGDGVRGSRRQPDDGAVAGGAGVGELETVGAMEAAAASDAAAACMSGVAVPSGSIGGAASAVGLDAAGLEAMERAESSASLLGAASMGEADCGGRGGKLTVPMDIRRAIEQIVADRGGAGGCGSWGGCVSGIGSGNGVGEVRVGVEAAWGASSGGAPVARAGGGGGTDTTSGVGLESKTIRGAAAGMGEIRARVGGVERTRARADEEDGGWSLVSVG